MEKDNMLNEVKTYIAPIDRKLQDSEDTTHPSVSDVFFSENYKMIKSINRFKKILKRSYFNTSVKH